MCPCSKRHRCLRPRSTYFPSFRSVQFGAFLASPACPQRPSALVRHTIYDAPLSKPSKLAVGKGAKNAENKTKKQEQVKNYFLIRPSIKPHHGPTFTKRKSSHTHTRASGSGWVRRHLRVRHRFRLGFRPQHHRLRATNFRDLPRPFSPHLPPTPWMPW